LKKKVKEAKDLLAKTEVKKDEYDKVPKS